MNLRSFTLKSLFIPSMPKLSLLRVVFGGLAVAGVVAVVCYNFGIFPGIAGGTTSSSKAVSPLPPPVEIKAAQQLASVEVAPIPKPTEPQAVVSGNPPSGGKDMSAGSVVSRGKALYSLEEQKNQKELELTVRKLDNDIRKEDAKSSFFAKNPEAAAGIEFKKKDEIINKVNVSEQLPPPPDPFEKLKFIGIIGERSVWSLNSIQVITRKGEWIAGYVVTNIANSGVTIEKDGKKVFLGLP